MEEGEKGVMQKGQGAVCAKNKIHFFFGDVGKINAALCK